MSKRTIEAGLAKFKLISGAGSEDTGEACAMTLLSWVANEEWSDTPECAHRLLANYVISANDCHTTTVRQRRALVVAGETGVLDTWWVPDSVYAEALSKASGKTETAKALSVIRRIAKWKALSVKPQANLYQANLLHADLSHADLSHADLSHADLRQANLSHANLSHADLSHANLSHADLSHARNLTLPAGWRLNAQGLAVRT